MATEISKFQQPEYPSDEALVRRRVELVPVDATTTANAAHTRSVSSESLSHGGKKAREKKREKGKKEPPSRD
jgi:hypothetical protein